MMKAFTDHPAAIGETYFEHQRVALWFSLRLIGAGLACAVHAFAPWLFVNTGSRMTAELHGLMAARHRPSVSTPAAARIRLVA
jgi:hypothetical protein